MVNKLLARWVNSRSTWPAHTILCSCKECVVDYDKYFAIIMKEYLQ